MNGDNNTIVDLLTSMGISRTDALTYAALLLAEEGSSIRKIAAQTGINRGTTYEALKRLMSLGLVSVKSRGRREHYSAESPEKIYELIRDRRHDLVEASNVAKQIVPDLLARRRRAGGSPLVRYYEDDEGVAAILKDVLQTCRTLQEPLYYSYSSSPIRHYLYRKFPKFTERRIAEGIRVKVIAVGEGGEIAPASERKWLAGGDKTDLSSYTIIYGSKVATISIAGDTPYGVVIEDGSAASMQRLLFERLWQYIPQES